jgi:transposase
MFFPERRVRVFVYGRPVDMRLGFTGLYALTRHRLGQDPMSGHLFVFVNRRGWYLRCLYWDRTGFCLSAKRLERLGFLLPGTVEVQGVKWTPGPGRVAK